MRRRTAPLLLCLTLLVAASACSSGGDEASTTTTAATTEATTSTSAPSPTTAATDGADGGLPKDCDAVLQQYVDTSNPDDLASTAALFRSWAPDLPPDVAEAALRLADAYEEAGSLDAIDVGDPSLGADAQTLSTWMDAGCPAP